MSNLIVRTSALWLASIATLCAASLTPSHALAESLYWSKFPVHTTSEAQCLRFASDTADYFNLQNKRVSPLEVAATRGGDYVSITCVGRGGELNAVAIVMVMGPEHDEVVSLRDQLADHLAGVICLEGC